MPSLIERVTLALTPLRQRRPALLIVLVVLVGLVPPLGLRDWWYPDEPDVALPIVEMHARGDLVVPTHNGVPWLDYPPLAYWGGLLLARLTGEVTPFVTRLPMVAFFVVLVVATIALGRRLLDERRALVAGVALLSMPVLWFNATNLQVDLGFAAAIAVGMACYVRGDAAAVGASWAWRIAAFAAFGVAILGKGPLGVLLPGLILTVWHAVHGEWRRLLALAPLALVSLAVAAPWYLLLGRELGFETVGRELYLQNFDRFGRTARGHGGKGYHYYLTSILPDVGAGILFLVPALWVAWRQRAAEALAAARQRRLLALWVLLPFVFFTLASTRRNVYLLPIYPALALLIAEVLVQPAQPWLLRWRGLALRAGALVLGGLGLLILGAVLCWPWLPRPARATPALMEALRPAVIAPALLLLLGAFPAWRSAACRPVRAGALLAGTQFVVWILVLWSVLPILDQERSFRPAAQELAARVPAGDAIGFLVPGREASRRPAWLCHLDGRRLIFFGDAAQALAWLAERPQRHLLIDPARVPILPGTRVVCDWAISGDRWQALQAASAP